MGIRAMLARPFAAWDTKRIRRAIAAPLDAQQRVFEMLVEGGSRTAFGREQGLSPGMSVGEFQQQVVTRDYEALRPWVDRVRRGEPDILWPGRPLYFAKTSGTTSGAKYIPITSDSIPNHIHSARAALSQYIYTTGKSAFADGKMIFLQGSPKMDSEGGIETGRLSGIAYHHVPAYLLRNRMPSFETNCMEDWETKLEAICRETIPERMTLISGIPPWVIMYYEKLLEMTGKSTISEIFPDFDLFIYGGVNFRPYKARMQELVGKEVDSIETYPASEGFIAFQDSREEEGLLLNVDSGIFFEFIPMDRIGEENPPRLTLAEVQTDVNYALILTNNAGLWAYELGDMVRFICLEPHRIVVSGRVKHFISAFGEHVIAEEVEKAMQQAEQKFGFSVSEFSVAPYIGGDNEPSRHEWYVAFDQVPRALVEIENFLDSAMCRANSYYKDLIEGKILSGLKVIPVSADAFRHYMRSKGKLGGQNKLPRLSNNREIADALQNDRLELH